MFGVAPAIVQWAHYVALRLEQNASLTLNNNNNNPFCNLHIGIILQESTYKMFYVVFWRECRDPIGRQ